MRVRTSGMHSVEVESWRWGTNGSTRWERKRFVRLMDVFSSLCYHRLTETFFSHEQINSISRENVESKLEFAGFLVFHCPLKPDAISTIRDLNDSSHRCVMITGDNPLTAAHVARQVEIVDRDVLILDHREGSEDETGGSTRRYQQLCIKQNR